MLIRLATVNDTEQILNIYTPYVEKTVISFETAVPSLAEMEERIKRALENHAWLVIEEGREILAYAYSSNHRDRPAYRWSADVSIYVKEHLKGKGIGKSLYTSLLTLLKIQGYQNVYAGICLPNEASIGIHEYFGFKKIAHYSQVGYKLGKWHDVGWWELSLLVHDNEPRDLISIKAIEESKLQEIFQLGIQSLKR